MFLISDSPHGTVNRYVLLRTTPMEVTEKQLQAEIISKAQCWEKTLFTESQGKMLCGRTLWGLD
jgi:hypothetical protein